MFIKYTMKEYNLWDKPLDHLCKKAIQRNVKEFMYTPTETKKTMNSVLSKQLTASFTRP